MCVCVSIHNKFGTGRSSSFSDSGGGGSSINLSREEDGCMSYIVALVARVDSHISIFASIASYSYISDVCSIVVRAYYG